MDLRIEKIWIYPSKKKDKPTNFEPPDEEKLMGTIKSCYKVKRIDFTIGGCVFSALKDTNFNKVEYTLCDTTLQLKAHLRSGSLLEEKISVSDALNTSKNITTQLTLQHIDKKINRLENDKEQIPLIIDETDNKTTPQSQDDAISKNPENAHIAKDNDPKTKPCLTIERSSKGSSYTFEGNGEPKTDFEKSNVIGIKKEEIQPEHPTDGKSAQGKNSTGEDQPKESDAPEGADRDVPSSGSSENAAEIGKPDISVGKTDTAESRKEEIQPEHPTDGKSAQGKNSTGEKSIETDTVLKPDMTSVLEDLRNSINSIESDLSFSKGLTENIKSLTETISDNQREELNAKIVAAENKIILQIIDIYENYRIMKNHAESDPKYDVRASFIKLDLLFRKKFIKMKVNYCDEDPVGTPMDYEHMDPIDSKESSLYPHDYVSEKIDSGYYIRYGQTIREQKVVVNINTESKQ